jgi:coenzyme F420-reducing hydrogenase delta subunit/ferredoxin
MVAAPPPRQSHDAPAFRPRIVALVCNWCTYSGADLAGTARREHPASVRIVRVPCSGRIGPLAILRAFAGGADGVVVSGCHPGDCHYVQGNLLALRRFAMLRALLELMGLDQRRLHFAWVSAAEGLKWAELVSKVTAAVREAGPLHRAEDAPAPPSIPKRARATPLWNDGAWQESLRTTAAGLLDDGRVACVIGYGVKGRLARVVPVFAAHREEARQLVWNERCAQDLAVHLRDALSRKPRVAVVAKACDARAMTVLLQERQLERERVVLLGAPCGGMADGDGLAARCATCAGEAPVDCDVTIPGAPVREVAAEDPRDAALDALLAVPARDRWAFWRAELSRCLRCYACRAACPLCTCTVCAADRHRPQWIPKAHTEEANLAWHVVRAFHLAGRCVGCDACTAACPADIRLDLLNRHLAREAEARFGYVSGTSAETPPLLSTFGEDGEEFIL